MAASADIDDSDLEPDPPDAHRVAARALVLAAISCRGLIEADASDPGAEKLRQRVVHWMDSIGISEEAEPSETALLSTPLGELEPKARIDSSWRAEGMAVLAWALRHAELPAFSAQCEPSDTANAMGFLDFREKTVLHSPRLRDSDQIAAFADRYLTIHWRLRQYSLEREPMDFVTYVARCNWGPLSLDGIEIVEADLGIGGVRIDRAENASYRQTVSIVQERHQAFNWLLGLERLYSRVTTDT